MRIRTYEREVGSASSQSLGCSQRARTSRLVWRTAEQPGEQARLWVRGPPLIARRQASVLAGSQHTVGVGVPPKPGVAFGRDQHVPAQSRQVPAAERAAVGRWLQAPGGMRRPPARPTQTAIFHHSETRSPGPQMRWSVTIWIIDEQHHTCEPSPTSKPATRIPGPRRVMFGRGGPSSLPFLARMHAVDNTSSSAEGSEVRTG